MLEIWKIPAELKLVPTELAFKKTELFVIRLFEFELVEIKLIPLTEGFPFEFVFALGA